ncbi:MAG: HD domain-containing protein, partial [Peptococcaceae bacterium]|nr:HD domain-containing protein [Peptococcaceae bacterium]
MRNLPASFKWFFLMVVTLATFFMVNTLLGTVWNRTDIYGLITFGLIAVASESLPVELPKGGFVSVTYAVEFSAIILFQPGIAMLVSAVAGIFPYSKEDLKGTFYKRIFNGAQFVISLKAASLVKIIFGLHGYKYSVASFLVYLGVASVFILVNMTLVSIALGCLQRKYPWVIWLSNIRWALPNFAALASLGFLMAIIYLNAGSIGLALLFIPLLLARHSFQRYMDMRANYLSTIKALVQAIEAKDQYTKGHSDRVAQFVVAIAQHLKMPVDKIDYIQYAAILHDVGKIGVSEAILNKEGKLLDDEWEIIRNHPSIGQQIVKDIKFLYDIDRGVRYHHERYDGRGYPDGLAGEAIPLEARIIAVADSYDAMTSD